MISVNEAKKIINENIPPASIVSISLENALNYVLAEDVISTINIPAFRQSSKDGYAIKFKDLQKEKLEIIGEQPAGLKKHFQVENAQCIRIFTGAPLPDDTDTIVMQEFTEKKNNQLIIVDRNIEYGQDVRDIGSEIGIGDLAINTGTKLQASTIGFLAMLGITEVKVYKFPKIKLIITGNELAKRGSELAIGQVFESNSIMLSAAIQDSLQTKPEIEFADDDLDKLTQIINSSLDEYDLILLTGGVSVGDYDYVKMACESSGIQTLFHRVKQKPGKPLYFGRKNNTIVFGLPGNPASSLSCYYVYIKDILLKFANLNNLNIVKFPLGNCYYKGSSLTHFLKAKIQNGKVYPLTAQESFRLSSFAIADSLIVLPEGVENFPENAIVDVLLLHS